MSRGEIVLKSPFPSQVPLEFLPVRTGERCPSDQDFGDVAGHRPSTNGPSPYVQNI